MSSGTYPKNYPKMTIISNNRRYTALNWKMINLAEMARYTTSRNNLKSGSGFLAHFKNSGGGIGFPTRDNVTDFLAITKGSTFAVPFIVIGAADSTQTGFIRGRNTDYNGTMNTNQYAYRLNNNGGTETGKMNLSKGDIAEFMLVYDGTNYYAYLLNNRT